MNTLDRESLLTLVRHFGWPSITIYLPTTRVPTQAEHDVLVLKNLIRSAEEKLAEGGLRPPEIDSLLAPIRSQITDSSAWREPADGRAFFIAPDTFHAFKTDAPMPESVVVGERFLVRPLLPTLDIGKRFLVLTLSQKHVRLLEGNGEAVHELDVAGTPDSLAEALNIDEYERSVQFHSGTPGTGTGGGRRAAMFHGHGGIPDVTKKNLKHYFRMIDRGIHDLLRDDDAPLVLAGVEYLLPLYRETNSYHHLVSEAILGNPDDLSPSEIHRRATDLLGPHFNERIEKDQIDLERLTGTKSSSADLKAILPAAVEGRVRVLFVSDRKSEWGRFDPSSGRVEIHAESESGDSDLTDLVTAETLFRGGTVHALPEQAATSAIFRY